MLLSPSTRLGPYEIISSIGAGGMGEVYRARDSRLGRDVAIKVLTEHLAHDPEALARFEREARAVAALSHPNILAIHDFGNDQGITYAVAELLEGETLRSRLGRGALSWRKAVEVAIALAEGLSAAHSKGIIHCDLKPENIFLTSDGRVKVLDFGLARWARAVSPPDQSSAPTETEAGTVMGTVGYMSPEQVRGSAAEAPSDIFSLGCVLYEMIAGHKAFARATASDTLAAILRDEPPVFADSGKQVPAELDRVVTRCLEKNPGQRFHSAHDLAFALKGVLTAAGARRVSSRSRWTLAALATTFALAVGMASYLYRRGGPAPQSPGIDSLAVLPFSNSSASPDAEYLSDGITETLINSLSQLPNLKVMSRSAVFRFKGRQADPQAVARELDVKAVLTGRLLERSGNLIISAELIDARDASHLWGEQYNRKLADVLTVQEDIATRISERLRLRLSGEDKKRLTKRYTENPEAYQLYLKGRYYSAKFTKEGLAKGIEYFHQAIATDPSYALAYDGLSYYYALTEDVLVPAREAMPKAREAAVRALELDDTLAAAHTEMGAVHFFYDYDWAAADRQFKRAIELDPNYAPAHEFYGWFLTSMGGLDDGAAESRKAQELDPLSAETNELLGSGLYFARRYPEAIDQLRKTIDLEPNYWLAHMVLGHAYQHAGRSPESIAAIQKAAQIETGLGAVPAALGTAYAAAGNRAAAQRILSELRERSKSAYVLGYAMAALAVGLGYKEDALGWLQKAYEQRSWYLTFLKVDPDLDPLRSHPRFRDLMRRMNLSP